jgi:Tfp pilus assembly protein PilN
MNAVNLIPADQRRGNSAAGRSGGAVYVLLGTLAVLVLLAGVYGVTSRQISSRTAEIADVSAQADAAEATANSLAGYTDFATTRKQRALAVKTVADSRVDWGHTLSEVARTMPSNSWLTSLHGTTNSTAAAAAAGATASTGAPVAATPTVELVGCTTTQQAVSSLMAELRRIDGVTGVRLTTSAKSGANGAPASAPAAAAGATSPCSGSNRTNFTMTLTFQAPAAAATTAAATTAAATTATQPATAGSTK